jgi:phosphoribosylanthranilate isomerase
VDVASGVESAPGVKDVKQMEQLIRRAKEAR